MAGRGRDHLKPAWMTAGTGIPGGINALQQQQPPLPSYPPPPSSSTGGGGAFNKGLPRFDNNVNSSSSNFSSSQQPPKQASGWNAIATAASSSAGVGGGGWGSVVKSASMAAPPLPQTNNNNNNNNSSISSSSVVQNKPSMWSKVTSVTPTPAAVSLPQQQQPPPLPVSSEKPSETKPSTTKPLKSSSKSKEKKKVEEKPKLTKKEIAARVEKKKRKEQADRKKRGDFLIDLRYRSNLPDVPILPKFLHYPFPEDWMYKYRFSTLERDHVRKVHLDPRIGTDVSLLDIRGMESTAISASLDPVDEHILRKHDVSNLSDSNDLTSSVSQGPVGRAELAKVAAKGKSWLVKTTYLENTHRDNKNKAPKRVIEQELRNRVLNQVASQVRTEQEEQEDLTPVERIERTFHAAKKRIIQHPTKSDLKPRKILDILPNLALGANSYHLMHIHDKNLKPESEALPPGEVAQHDRLHGPQESDKRLERAFFRVLKSERNAVVSSYFLPTIKKDALFLKPSTSSSSSSSSSSSMEQDDEDDIFKIEDDDEEEKHETISQGLQKDPDSHKFPHYNLDKLAFVRDYRVLLEDLPPSTQVNRRFIIAMKDYNTNSNNEDDSLIQGQVTYVPLSDHAFTCKREKLIFNPRTDDAIMRRIEWDVIRRDISENEASERFARAKERFGSATIDEM